MSGWGVMNQVAIKEASAQGFPMDRFIGNWWSGSENDVLPVRRWRQRLSRPPPSTRRAVDTRLHADIKKYVYDARPWVPAMSTASGEVLYIRGLFNHVMVVESIRRAQDHYRRQGAERASRCGGRSKTPNMTAG